MSGNRSLLKWIFILGFAGVLILGFILAFGSYRVYSQMDERLSSISPVSIWFENPQQGSTLPSGNPLLITARAQGPYPILYMQLESEGEVVGIIGAPSAQGVMILSADFNWLPAEIKTYKLTARAFDTMGNEADATLAIEITAAEQVTEVDIQNAYEPVGLHAPAGLGQGGGDSPLPLSEDPPYQPPQPPVNPEIDLTTTYASAEPWSPTLVNWFDFVLTNPNKPAAPGIPATAVEGCKPRIWISDNSDNEDGFRVFRRDPNSLNFFEVGVEAAYDGPVFTFEDEEDGLFGTYEYQVSAFNQSGESLSNISESVEVDSPNCQPDNQPVIQIDLSKILALQSYDKGYCYYSLDAEHWQRHPLNPQEFLGSGQVGELPEGVLKVLQPQGPQKLDLECWGWAGGLQMIGKWHFDDVIQDHADLGLVTLGDGGAIHTYGGDMGGGAWDPELPVPFAFLGSGPQECGTYSNIPNPLVLGLICGDVADDLDFVYWGYLDFSYLQGEEPVDVVGYNVYDTLGALGTPVQHIQAPATIYFPFDPTACEARLISVTLLANVNGEIHESAPSNQVIYSPEEICGYIAGTEPRMYRVTWETIDFSVGNIDDGVDVEDDAEGFGFLALTTDTGHEQFWHMTTYEFEDDSEENPYQFSGIPLGLHDNVCLGLSCIFSGEGSGTGNNTANFPLFIGEGFKLTVYLVDYDDDQEHDILCSIDPSTSNLRWNGSEVGGPGWVTTVSRTAHHNDADCKVTIKIEGLP